MNPLKVFTSSLSLVSPEFQHLTPTLWGQTGAMFISLVSMILFSAYFLTLFSIEINTYPEKKSNELCDSNFNILPFTLRSWIPWLLNSWQFWLLPNAVWRITLWKICHLRFFWLGWLFWWNAFSYPEEEVKWLPFNCINWLHILQMQINFHCP